MNPAIIPTLLTGGGFVFLAALIGGLAMYNKNRSDAVKSLAEGAVDVVQMLREQLSEVRKDLKDCDARLDECAAEREKVKGLLRKTLAWNTVLTEKLESLGISLEPPPRAEW